MRILICCMFLLSGCASKGVNTTLFLKEDGKRFYNLKNEDCLESGYQVDKGPDGQYRLITYFSNCDIHTERKMKEFEPKLWGITPKLKKGTMN